MEPHYQSRHARQVIGLDGRDLAGNRRREILESAKSISRDSIQQFDLTQFHVASQSRPGAYYAIDLHRVICDCRDFPRIQFCKHIAAIYVHFPHLSTDEISPSPTPPLEATEAPVQPPHISTAEENLHAMRQGIDILAQADRSSPAVQEAIRSVNYSITAAVASTQGSSALPDKDLIVPNQKSWPETAKRMGVIKAPKRKRLPEERGLTEQCIGVAKGKRRRIHTDPYAGGERSGKRAKPDACSAAANTRARASPSAAPVHVSDSP
jgi:hypothetical protein